jgi:nitrate reductase assembly molybdenum cofactor insertion protein NarJ
MTSSSVTELRPATELLAEAAEWRLLGLLLACPHGDWRDQVAALAAEVHDDSLQTAAQAALDEATESGYHTVFGPGGPGAPREVSHRQATLTGDYLAELLAFYHAFAYCPPHDEPPDHIAAEIDFIAYLQLKQAYAVARSDETQAAVTAQAMQSFIQDHLVTTAVPLTQILDSSGIPYLSLAATALSERLGAFRTESVCSSLVLDLLGNQSLPSCDTCDHSPELSD